MSTATALPAPMNDGRRLILTLLISLLLHSALILGVVFAASEDAPLVPTLDVIFSQTSTPLTPKQADFLAQANQQGGGDHDTAQRPRDSQPGVVPQDRTGLAPQAQRATSVTAPAPTQTRVVSSRHGEQTVPTPQPNPHTIPLTSADAQRLQRDAEMARLAAEVHLRSEQYAKRPNRKFVSASTREYAYANYLRAWVDRAERVGNLNYPDDVRRRRLGGKVVISVGVRRDGSVESSRVLVSSGMALLDDAALRVVRLAQPFPPLPNTEGDVDILQVTRTWLFLPDGALHDDR